MHTSKKNTIFFCTPEVFIFEKKERWQVVPNYGFPVGLEINLGCVKADNRIYSRGAEVCQFPDVSRKLNGSI